MRRLLILAIPALLGAVLYGSQGVQLTTATAQPASTAGLQSCVDAILQENLQAIGIDCPAVPSSPDLPAGAGRAFLDSQVDNQQFITEGTLPFYPSDELSSLVFVCIYDGGSSCTGNFSAEEEIAAPDAINGTCDASWITPLSSLGNSQSANTGTLTAHCQGVPLSGGGPAVTFSVTVVAVVGQGAYVATS